MKLRSIIGVFIVIFFCTTSNAMAYIDPGTGSVISTAILGLFAAITFTFRKYIYKIKNLFSKKSKKDDSA